MKIKLHTLHTHKFASSSQYEKESHAVILSDECDNEQHTYKLLACIVNEGVPTVYTRDFQGDKAGACLEAHELHERLLRCYYAQQMEGYNQPLDEKEGWSKS